MLSNGNIKIGNIEGNGEVVSKFFKEQNIDASNFLHISPSVKIPKWGIIILSILFVTSTASLGFIESQSIRFLASLTAFVCMSLIVILSYMKWQNGIVSFMVLVFSITILALAYGVFTPEEIILQYKNQIEQHVGAK